MQKYRLNEKGQAVPSSVVPITQDAFRHVSHTEIRWLGGAGILLNSRGTVILIDPVLQGFDMPLLFEPPLFTDSIPHLEAVLVTHIDSDHFSRETVRSLMPVCGQFHSTQYVAEQMRTVGIPGVGHDIQECFRINDVMVSPTPAKHNWQNDIPEYQYRVWKEEEYCGFWFDTPDGTVWLPGDSRLIPDHLHMPDPNVILLDFSDDAWHISLNGAILLANAYPQAQLICIHWGTVDAPDMPPFNGNPEPLFRSVIHPERIHILFPGEPFPLS